MAQLASRGVFSRNRLDFYESSNCWAFTYGMVVSGSLSAYLLNNSSAAAQLDVYGVQWFSSSAQVWNMYIVPAVQTVTPISSYAAEIHPIQPDLPAPPGVVGLASAYNPSTAFMVLRQSGGAMSGSLDLGYWTPHITLPPTWALVLGANVTAQCELSVTFFYQQVSDLVMPAR